MRFSPWASSDLIRSEEINSAFVLFTLMMARIKPTTDAPRRRVMAKSMEVKVPTCGGLLGGAIHLAVTGRY